MKNSLFCAPTGYSEIGDSSSGDVESQSPDLYRGQLLHLLICDPENFADMESQSLEVESSCGQFKQAGKHTQTQCSSTVK